MGLSREIRGQTIKRKQRSDALVRRRHPALLQAEGSAPALQRFSVAAGLAGLMLSIAAVLRGQGWTSYHLHHIGHVAESRVFGSGT
jgi:hypothetical protein